MDADECGTPMALATVHVAILIGLAALPMALVAVVTRIPKTILEVAAPGSRPSGPNPDHVLRLGLLTLRCADIWPCANQKSLWIVRTQCNLFSTRERCVIAVLVAAQRNALHP